MRLAPALVPLLLVGALSGCSGSSFQQPAAGAFRAGSCRALAPSVLALGRDLHGLGKGSPSADQRAALKAHQRTLRDLQPGVATTLAPPVEKLVAAVGIVRLRADTGSWDGALAGPAMQAYGDVVRACTTPSG